MTAARLGVPVTATLRWPDLPRVAARPARLREIGLAIAAAVGFSLSVAYAAGAPAAKPVHVDAASFLSQIQWAAEHRTYSGRFVHQEGDQIQTSRIVHSAEPGGEVEKLEMLDGRIREYVRHGDDVQGFIPDRKLIVVERRVRREKFPALLAAPATDVNDHYRFEPGNPERVAGHLCDVAQLTPRDDLRFGYRLWVDRSSGLLLKVETLDAQGTVLEQVAFTDIRIGGHIDPNQLKPSFSTTDGWHTEEHPTQPASFDGADWNLTVAPPGFRPILEVKRTFGNGREVGQIVLSDGLAAVSLFVESASGSTRTEGEASKGSTHIVTKSLGGTYWVTVVGEVPLKTVREIASQVALRAPANEAGPARR